jgi:hypothetical protein
VNLSLEERNDSTLTTHVTQQVFAQSPGARIFVVCSRAASPPQEVSPEIWTERVQKLSAEVHGKVSQIHKLCDCRLLLPCSYIGISLMLETQDSIWFNKVGASRA